MSVHPYLQDSGPLAIAHRGGALETPENTLEAFRYLETDSHLTKDGVVVAFHDDVLDRVSEEAGPINAWNWVDLQSVPITGGGSMITIEQLLAEFPETYFNIDVKSDEVVQPLLRVLDNQRAYDRVCIGSFSDARLVSARSARPEQVCTSFGPRGIARCVLASFGLPVEPPLGDALQIPVSLRGFPLLTQRLVDYAHKMNLSVHAWTIDDEAEMHRLLDLGVDGIMTDRPSVLKDVFIMRGLGL